MDPFVSVIIPCFNAAKTIAATIASVRRQTYPNFEIIAVDDCSTDETLELLRREEAHGVRVIARERNGGAAAARNDGIAAARGAFLAFIDADDEWHPDKLRRQIAIIAARRDMVLIGCRAETIRLDGSRVPVNPGRNPPIGAEAWRLMLRETFFVPSVILARSDAVRRIGGENAALRAGEDDQDFCIRLALVGEVGFVDEVLTIMHEQPGSLSSRFLSREHETVLPMILSHCRVLRGRLTRGELRDILGARYTRIGRNVYLSDPAAGARLLLRAIALGTEPLTNLWYLASASPGGRWLKRRAFGRG
ncbi:MAG TPA: glycosyltransferase family 2 protein [Stellaceae bacterium]|nr:glycosyltransferase family 2 protein [Stellaceae bacterium]